MPIFFVMITDTTMIKCTGECQKYKPLSQILKDHKGKPTKQCICHTCYNKWRKSNREARIKNRDQWLIDYAATYPDKINLITKEFKCANGHWKAFSEFGQNRNNAHGMNYICVECRKQQNKTERSKKIEKLKLKLTEFRTLIKEKLCSYCKEVRPSKDFPITNDTNDGYYPHCKTCVKGLKILLRLEKGLDVRIDSIMCPLPGYSLCKVHGPLPYDNFQNSSRSKNKYSTQCKVCIAKMNESHKDKKNAAHRIWRKNNMPQVRATRRKYEKHKMATDSTYAVHRRIHSQLNKDMKGKKCGRRYRDIIGNTKEQLENRLRFTLLPDMTWQDFMDGKLHIEHIIPKRAFGDISENEQMLKLCWRLENLRLEWGADNCEKIDLMPDGRLARDINPPLSYDQLEKLIEEENTNLLAVRATIFANCQEPTF